RCQIVEDARVHIPALIRLLKDQVETLPKSEVHMQRSVAKGEQQYVTAHLDGHAVEQETRLQARTVLAGALVLRGRREEGHAVSWRSEEELAQGLPLVIALAALPMARRPRVDERPCEPTEVPHLEQDEEGEHGNGQADAQGEVGQGTDEALTTASSPQR